MEFSNRGAVVQTWQLNKYFDDQKPPKPLDLVNDAVAQQLGWPFSVLLNDPQQEAKANSALYQVTVASGGGAAVPLTAATQTIQVPAEIDFHWSDGHLDVTKKLAFDESYETKVTLSVTLDGAPQPAAIAWRGGFGDKAAYNGGLNLNVFYKVRREAEHFLPVKKVGVSKSGAAGDAIWAAAVCGNRGSVFHGDIYSGRHCESGAVALRKQDHNFVTGQQAADRAGIGNGCRHDERQCGDDARVRGTERDLGILEKMNPQLTELINFGWFTPIAKGLLWVLQLAHTKVPNWGWCIVLMTVVINMILFPLKMKGWRSMQKMQRVGPEIRQIQGSLQEVQDERSAQRPR